MIPFLKKLLRKKKMIKGLNLNIQKLENLER